MATVPITELRKYDDDERSCGAKWTLFGLASGPDSDGVLTRGSFYFFNTQTIVGGRWSLWPNTKGFASVFGGSIFGRFLGAL